MTIIMSLVLLFILQFYKVFEMKLIKIISLFPFIFCGYILVIILSIGLYIGQLPKYGTTPDPTSMFPEWVNDVNNVMLLFFISLLLCSPIMFIIVSAFKWRMFREKIIYWAGIYILGIVCFFLLRATTYFEWLLD